MAWSSFFRRAGTGCAIILAITIAGGGCDKANPAIATKKPGNNHVLFLLSGRTAPDAHGQVSMLAQELYRQGLLIAARDGMGVQTRDASLREFGASPADQSLAVVALLDSIDVRPAVGSDQSLWHDASLDKQWTGNFPSQMSKIEAWSRKDFIELLKDNGWSGTGNVVDQNLPAAPDAEQRLGQLEELSQFAAVRVDHQLIRATGESNARLGVLVRGYANLGQLTRYHWSTEHQVYTARSLLYAQRLVAQAPSSALALYHRAYALALAGLPKYALADLDAAAALGDPAPPPSWVALLAPFCHEDIAKLSELADTDATQAPFAMYLALVAVEHSACNGAMLSIGTKAQQLNPNCLRICDSLCDATGPGLLNDLTEQGPQIFSQTLGRDLPAMPGLPKAIVDEIQAARRPNGNPQARQVVCKELIALGSPDHDSAELSWAALGRMIQETTFAQVRRRAYLIALGWGVDASDYVAEFRDSIDDHPLRDVIEVYGLWHTSPFSAARAKLKNVSWNNLAMEEFPIYELEADAQSHGADGAADLLTYLNADADMTSFDQEAWFAIYFDSTEGDFLKATRARLKYVSPDSPWVLCSDIDAKWSARKVREAEANRGNYPTVALHLAKAFEKQQQPADAERCWKKYIAVSPDSVGYQGLAKLYKSQGQENLWESTLRDYLTQTPSYDLTHAQVQVELADFYISRHDYFAAVPYADAAGQTASGWGLNCAARAHTAIRDFDVAERLLREEQDHYSDSPFGLYSWCVLTNHGNRAGAYAQLQAYVVAKGSEADEEDLLQLAVADAVEGRQADAVGLLRRRHQQFPGPISLAHMLVYADQAGDAEALASTIDMAKSPQPQTNPPASKFLEILLEAYTSNPQTLDTDALDALTAPLDAPTRAQMWYIAACYLDKHGHADQATAYLKRCKEGQGNDCVECVAINQALRARGLDPMDLTFPALPPVR